MSDAGQKIIEGLRDALAGNFARVTIEGQTWVRADNLLQIEVQIEDLKTQLVDYEQIKSERDELDELFELQCAADRRAVKRWQDAHPDRSNIWPDRADMVVWLMGQLEK